MSNRRVRSVLNGVAIAALLFAQIVGAAQACAAASDTPEMAFTEMDCADMPSQNVCLQQYISGDQNPGTPQIMVAPMPSLAVLLLPVQPVSLPAAAERARECPPGAADPPDSIRFCSFQL